MCVCVGQESNPELIVFYHLSRKCLKTYILLAGMSGMEHWHSPCKSKPCGTLLHQFSKG